jgi:hypothetical protein
MRGDESFAYDLDVQHRPVNSRQALLFGSIEGKRSRWLDLYTPILQPAGLSKGRIIECKREITRQKRITHTQVTYPGGEIIRK